MNEAAILKVMAETGMGRLQAYRHLKDRAVIARLPRVRKPVDPSDEEAFPNIAAACRELSPERRAELNEEWK